MFGRIFLKEWRENFILFALGVIVLLGVFVLFLSQQEKTALFGGGVFLLFVLPFLALLIGSSGFQSELKNNSWTYLFSRPVAKPLIWMMKYVSQLSIIAVLLGLWALLRALVPGFARLTGQLDWPFEHLDLSSSALYVFVLFLAFTAAFSISFLAERPLLILAISLLIVLALVVVLYPYGDFLWRTYFHLPFYAVFLPMLVVSFALASLLTFIRADLSQRRRVAVRYAVLVAAFLAVSFAVQTVIASGGNPFNTRKDWLTFHSGIAGSGRFFFGSEKHGLMEYDPATNQTRQISASAELYWHRPILSVAEGRIAFAEWVPGAGRAAQAIRVIGLKDHREIGRVEFFGAGSPFGEARLVSNCLLSPDGERIAFAAEMRPGAGQKRVPTLVWMKADGSETHQLSLDFVGTDPVRLLGWMPSEDKIVVLIVNKFHGEEQTVAIIDLATRNVQKAYSGRSNFISISPRSEFILYELPSDRADVAQLMLLDIKKLSSTKILDNRYLSVFDTAWTQNEDRVAFNQRQDVLVYSLPDGPLVTVALARNPSYYYHHFFDWLGGGKELAVYSISRDKDMKSYAIRDRSIKIFDAGLQEKKSFPVPEISWPSVWSVGSDLFAGGWDAGLWRLDFKSGTWKRIY